MKVGLTKGNLVTSTDPQYITYDSGLGDIDGFILYVWTNTAVDSVVTSDVGKLRVVGDGTNTRSSFEFNAGDTDNRGAFRGVDSAKAFMRNDAGTTIIDFLVTFDTANNRIVLDFSPGTTPAAAYEYALISFHGAEQGVLTGYASTNTTVSVGFDWDAIYWAGASTSSANTGNGAYSEGVCDKSANQCVMRHGQANGTTTYYATLRNNHISANMFTSGVIDYMTVDTITTNGFDFSITSSTEEGVYIVVGCDNDVEVIESCNLDTTTDPESVTTTHEPDYILMSGLCDGVINTDYVNTSGSNHWVGFADLSAGVGGSGDYFGFVFTHDRDGVSGCYSDLSHTYCIHGADADGTAEEFEANVSAKGGTSVTFDKVAKDSQVSFWMLNIGADSGGGGTQFPKTITDTASGTDIVEFIRTLRRSITDTASSTDTVDYELILKRSVVDVASATDTVDYKLILRRSITDVADGYDEVVYQTGIPAEVLDVASSTDEVTFKLVRRRGLTDIATLQDEVTFKLDLVRAIVDVATLQDSVEYSVVTASQFPFSVTDVATATDEVVYRLGLRQTITDTASAVDSVAFRLIRRRSVTDVATGTDTVGYTTSGTSTVTLADLDKKIQVILAILLGRRGF